METVSSNIAAPPEPAPVRWSREAASSLGHLVRNTDKALLQTPLRATLQLCDRAAHSLGGFSAHMGRLGPPVLAVGTRALDVTQTSVELASGIVRDVLRTALDVPVLLLRDAGPCARSVHERQWGRAAGQLARTLARVGLRVLGCGSDIAARTAQGCANAVLTLAFLEAPSRPLRTEEVLLLKRVYGDSIDYAVVRLRRGGSTDWLRLAPHVVGNTVHMAATWGGLPSFRPDGSLTREGLETLTHEAGHVWQSQNGGGCYMHRALLAQLGAFLRGGSRNGAYAWRPGFASGLSFEGLNPEQQATLMEEIGLALRDHGQVTASAWSPPLSPPELRFVLSAWEKLRRGEGCPA
ncbi:hypothetical protein P2318_11005 [Myxococcaceae bacterium GXIMD 01537]